MKEARHLYEGEKFLGFAESAMDAVRGADALVIMTEWKAFRSPDFDALKAALESPVIFDGRNLYEPAVVASHGLEYYPIGRKTQAVGVAAKHRPDEKPRESGIAAGKAAE
jgi:UDPglucose 6-dehydrogenase